MKFKGIRMKIFLAMMLTTVVPLGITSGIIVYQVSQDMKEDLQFARDRTEQDLKGRIDEYMQALDETAYQIYSNPDLIESLNNNSGYLPDESRTYDTVRDIREFFLSVYNNSRVKGIAGMYLINAKEETVGNFFPKFFPRFDNSYIHRLLIDAKVDEGSPTIRFDYKSMYNEPILQYLYPVKSLGQPTALLVIDIYEPNFRSMTERYNIFNKGLIEITDSSGNVVYHTLRERVNTALIALDTGSDTNVIETKIPSSEWNLYYIFRTDPKLLFYRKIAVLMIGFAGLLAIFFSFLLSYSITKPIVNMHRKMGRIQIGDYDARVDVRTNDEIGFLGNQFNRMAETIQRQIEHELKLQLTNQESQIKALQAQISPHFLFNTLQTMTNIASLNRVPDMKLICQSLSNMYRYNMNIHDEWVQVKDETAHIRNYLVIINKRIPDGIRIRIAMNRETRLLWIPKLILQPIVENAVDHGLIPLLGKKKLMKISSTIDHENRLLYIHVLDNGTGLTGDQMENLLHRLDQMQTPSDSTSHSIGLTNVQTRIKLICGAEYGISVHSKESKGTCITFKLPLKEAKPS